jgi:NADH dehydrogenase [ubiquinone] 1 alpha subcomplex assembly factor 7
MNRVEETLKRRIRQEGPLSIADFMSEALLHPDGGYYTTATPFGTAGDFTTAPEISQVFGELIGLWAADCWARLGRPAPLRIIEMGPGRGTLMADFLRAARALPGFLESASLHLVEASPRLQAQQAERLKTAPLEPQWHRHLSDVPPGPFILIANEYFDALPIRQYEFREGGWHERRVGLSGDALTMALGPGTPPWQPAAPPEDGDVLEIGMLSLSEMRGIAERLAQDKGAALIIDYGYGETAYGDSFQAVRRHAFADPFKAPGEADLTAHVDFERLARVAREAGAAAFGPIPQGPFLKALGIDARTERLCRTATAPQRAALLSATDRLTAPDRMGTLFKVLAVTSPNAPIPAAFPESR